MNEPRERPPDELLGGKAEEARDRRTRVNQLAFTIEQNHAVSVVGKTGWRAPCTSAVLPRRSHGTQSRAKEQLSHLSMTSAATDCRRHASAPQRVRLPRCRRRQSA